jgi:hypothetical protein
MGLGDWTGLVLEEERYERPQEGGTDIGVFAISK